MKWPTVKFAQLVSNVGVFSDGDWIESKDQDPDGDVRLVQLADIGVGNFINKSNRFMTKEASARLKCTYLEPGDILIARMPDPIGRACLFPNEMGTCVTVVDICIVRPNSHKVHNKWLMHLINSSQFQNQIKKHVTGTTRQRISRGNLSKLVVSLPPLEEQKRIAAILDKADAIRRKRQQAIDLADEFLRSVFLDMFGDPVTNPKGWEVVEVETISNVQGGLQVSSKREPNPLTVPYLRVANVLRDRLDLSEIKEINVNDSELNRVRLFTGDILVVEGHGNPDEIGRAAIWDRYVEDIVHQNHLIRIRPDRSKISSIFLNDFINSSGGRTQMANASNTTSGLNTISTGIVKSTKTILPPLEVQAEYEKVVSKVRKFRMDMAQLLANEMEYLFSSLSQKAFSGEL